MFDIELGCKVVLENGTVATVIDQLEDDYFKVMLRNGQIKEINSDNIIKAYGYNNYSMNS